MRRRNHKLGLSLLALAVAGVGLAYGFFRRDLAAAHARLAGASHVAATRCGPIEYAVAGAGPPILVVHGAGGGFDQGLAVGRSLAARGHRVIAMSRFGYLRTPLPLDASASAQADAHACLLRTSRLTSSRASWRRRSRSAQPRSEEHTSELQSHVNLVCRLLLEKK